MSTVVEMKSSTDMFATMWTLKLLTFLGLTDILLQCGPEPSLIMWAENVTSPNDLNEQSFEVFPDVHIRATEESEILRNSCRDRREQCWRQCKSTHLHRPTADSALDEMDCSTCNLAHSSFQR